MALGRDAWSTPQEHYRRNPLSLVHVDHPFPKTQLVKSIMEFFQLKPRCVKAILINVFLDFAGTSRDGDTEHGQLEIFKQNLSNRGPDSWSTAFQTIGESDLVFGASVLWLQGRDIMVQPLETQNSIFVYNGDIFGDDSGKTDQSTRNNSGDTAQFLSNLENSQDILRTLKDTHGPYAFIYLDLRQNKLYFGRDCFGRRSLLIGKPKNSTGDNAKRIILSSVAKRNTGWDFTEVPSIGIFQIDLLDTSKWLVHPWPVRNQNFEQKLLEFSEFVGQRVEVVTKEHLGLKSFQPLSSNCLELMEKVQAIINSDHSRIFDCLLSDTGWLNKVTDLEQLLSKAVEKRISTQPKFCQNCIKKFDSCCSHSITGVLFSGGIDCAILAMLADKFESPERSIDLINVAFGGTGNYNTPDRRTGLDTLEELKKLCPSRKWNFVRVDVTLEELNSARNRIIADLIYPLNTILDDSLGCALWFASRARTDEYTSPCRILLVGMGADELFGGYTKHRAALKQSGWEGLHRVLDVDWQNLPHRNLARDDRVVSDHGRQLRTPYLDENVVGFVRNLDCWERSWPLDNIPHGVGEKILLRTLGHKLGLKNAASLKKRALQFGSRIANPKENAHEVSQRLCDINS